MHMYVLMYVLFISVYLPMFVYITICLEIYVYIICIYCLCVWKV